MFSGLISHTGLITSRRMHGSGYDLTVEADSSLARGVKKGDSVAVDGVCLTVTRRKGKSLEFEVAPETVKKTIIGQYTRGRKVNLELPLRAVDRLQGHIVLGHVDGRGVLESRERDHTHTLLRIRLPAELAAYAVPRGSLTVNGVSLTIARVAKNIVTIALINTTSRRTNLGKLAIGQETNIESDILAKYVELISKIILSRFQNSFERKK